MIRFYNNRELSDILGVNRAKWKRWSREFLPPDPLGGLQSGYARQYNLNEAFSVYLGGLLVGELKFTIPESRKILNDLNTWLTEHGFYFDFGATLDSEKKQADPARYYEIIIVRREISDPGDTDLVYRIKTVIQSENLDGDGRQILQERHIEEFIGGSNADARKDRQAGTFRGLNISALHRRFLDLLIGLQKRG
jgi:hypothetical protein